MEPTFTTRYFCHAGMSGTPSASTCCNARVYPTRAGMSWLYFYNSVATERLLHLT